MRNMGIDTINIGQNNRVHVLEGINNMDLKSVLELKESVLFITVLSKFLNLLVQFLNLFVFLSNLFFIFSNLFLSTCFTSINLTNRFIDIFNFFFNSSDLFLNSSNFSIKILFIFFLIFFLFNSQFLQIEIETLSKQISSSNFSELKELKINSLEISFELSLNLSNIFRVFVNDITLLFKINIV